jgi:hypothetical protein
MHNTGYAKGLLAPPRNSKTKDRVKEIRTSARPHSFNNVLILGLVLFAIQQSVI